MSIDTTYPRRLHDDAEGIAFRSTDDVVLTIYWKTIAATLALSDLAFSSTANIDTADIEARQVTLPGPIIELIAYEEPLCQVAPVDRTGNIPNFQLLELVYNPTTRANQCGKINENLDSFSWTLVATLDPAASSCSLYFYKGDSCFNDNVGPRQLKLDGTNACRNLKNVRSVRLFC